MEFNRNTYFMLGLLLLLLGIQFRNVDSVVLNEKVTRFLAEKLPGSTQAEATMVGFFPSGAGPKKVIKPPPWLGWSLVSIGSVLILHSLAMKKPGG